MRENCKCKDCDKECCYCDDISTEECLNQDKPIWAVDGALILLISGAVGLAIALLMHFMG